MKKTAVLVALMGAIVLLLLAGAGQATVISKDSGKESWGPELIENPCTGESILMEGFYHWHMTIVEHDNGRSSFKWHANTYAEGTSPEGTKYVLIDTQNWIEDLPGTFPYVWTKVKDYKVISQGKASNFFMRWKIHMTISASGVPAALSIEVSTECRGK